MVKQHNLHYSVNMNLQSGTINLNNIFMHRFSGSLSAKSNGTGFEKKTNLVKGESFILLFLAPFELTLLTE